MLSDLRDPLLLESPFLLGALLLLGSPLSCCGHPSSARGTYLISFDGRSFSAGVSLFCWSNFPCRICPIFARGVPLLPGVPNLCLSCSTFSTEGAFLVLDEPNFRLRCPIFIGRGPFCGRRRSFVGLSLFWWWRPSSGGTAPRLRVRTPLLLERLSSTRRTQLLLKVIGYVCWGNCSIAGSPCSAGDAPLPPGPLGRPTSAGGAPGPTAAGRAQLLLQVPPLYWAPLFFRHPSPDRAPLSAGRPSARGAPLLLGAPHYCWTSLTFA